MIKVRLLGAIAALTLAVPAEAAWFEARTAHFRVFADSQYGDVRALAAELERFDAVLRSYQSVPDTPEALANPVTIYVVRDVPTLQRVGNRSNGVAGFYVPRATGSVAYTPARAGMGSKRDVNPKIILFHEYAHHFLLQNSSVAYPQWFGEGYAEFVSTVRFDAKYATIGHYALHRADELFSPYIDPPTIRQLFDPPRDRAINIYGRGWLLTHYVMLDPDRRQQLARYLGLFNAGTPSVEAAQKAFGDIDSVNNQLDAYRNRRSFPAVSLPLESLKAPQVAVRALGPGASALIEYRMMSDAGVDAERAAQVYAAAAPIAARHPDDVEAQGWFAEMAFDARQLDAAEAAADRALARDPKSSQALLYKARALMKRAGGDPAKWTAARAYILRANAARADDPAALLLFYESFREQKARPSAGAIKALYRSAAIVPQSSDLRYLAARQLLIDGDLAGARRVIRPAAYYPHAGPDSAERQMLALLDKAPSPATALTQIEALEAKWKAEAEERRKKGD